MRSGIQPDMEKRLGIKDICYALCCVHIGERAAGKDFTDDQVLDILKKAAQKKMLDPEGWVLDPPGIAALAGAAVKTVEKVKAGAAYTPGKDTALLLEKKTALASYTHFVHPDGFDPMGDRPARLGYEWTGMRVFR